MLYMMRDKGEAVIINGNIRVVVLESSPKGVKLGIDSPRKARIYREEVFLRIQEENKRAALSSKLLQE
jgi:carbon storage regulator